jgi:hypothetical protein
MERTSLVIRLTRNKRVAFSNDSTAIYFDTPNSASKRDTHLQSMMALMRSLRGEELPAGLGDWSIGSMPRHFTCRPSAHWRIAIAWPHRGGTCAASESGGLALPQLYTQTLMGLGRSRRFAGDSCARCPGKPRAMTSHVFRTRPGVRRSCCGSPPAGRPASAETWMLRQLRALLRR